MLDTQKCDAYSPFAWFYDTYFDFHEHSLFILDKLLTPRLPRGSRILDLCCGTGHLSQALASRGFSIVGIDGSAEMLSYAKQKVPAGEFIAADARDFKTPSTFKAVVSMFDSMNHILSIEELRMVFRSVSGVLEEGGYFLFDLNMEEAFETQWHKASSIIKKDNVCIINGSYDPHEKIGVTRLTMFLMEEAWRRSDAVLYQKCYSPEEVVASLERTGFKEIEAHDARKDIKMPGHLAIGRTVFLAQKKHLFCDAV
jgi:SAM-dependent methyltransferase